MQKKYLELFYKTLANTNPKLAEARIRDSVLKDIKEEVDKLTADRLKIYETLCDKKEDGTLDKKDNGDGSFLFSFKEQGKMEELIKEVETLVNEEIDIKISPKVKEFLPNTNYGFMNGEVELFDELLTKI